MKALQHVFQVDAAMSAELNRERASALGNTGRKLEDAIAACAAIAKELETCKPGALRSSLLEEYETNRKQAVTQRWNLEVQREAMGVRKHTDLDTFFPMPKKLTE
jgi:hypothetical protein